MNLAMEIPIAHLEEFSQLTDDDFALAHLVLNDATYADFYAEQRKKGRRVVLDNGMHEMGKPLTVPEILEAAKRINPSCVIPPDRIGDAQFTWEGFDQLRKHPSNRWDPALVIQGASAEDRISLFMHGRKWTYTIMFPFREPRTEWFVDMVRRVPKTVQWPPHLHLLGVNSLEELRLWTNLCEIHGWSARNVAVDTGKPIKWALKGRSLAELEDVRKGGLIDPKSEMDDAAKALAYFNIAYLRRFTS
jgi:hypothetical protein